MIIVVRRPYAYLLPNLQKVFEDHTDVEVKVDCRYGEQRTKRESFLKERRLSDRRIEKKALVDVVISTQV